MELRRRMVFARRFAFASLMLSRIGQPGRRHHGGYYCAMLRRHQDQELRRRGLSAC